MTTLLYLMACLMSPAPLINLAESRVVKVFRYDWLSSDWKSILAMMSESLMRGVIRSRPSIHLPTVDQCGLSSS